MRKLLQIIIITLCVLPIYGKAQGVKFYGGTVYEALDEARRTRKMILVEFYAPWSHKSRWMHDVVNRATYLNNHFIVCSVDTDTKEGAGIASQYSVGDYPFIVLFNSNGDPIDKIDRALSPEDFGAHITALRLTNDRESISKLSQIYTIASTPSLATAQQFRTLVADYLSTQNREHLLANSHWDLFASPVITYYGSDTYLYLLKYYKEFFSVEEAKSRVTEVVYDAILPFIVGNQELGNSQEIFAEILSDSATMRVVPSAEKLISLAKLRVEGSEYGYVKLLTRIVDEIDVMYEYQLIMSLDFVANSTFAVDKPTKKAALKLVEHLRQKSLSPSKLLLIEALLAKFS